MKSALLRTRSAHLRSISPFLLFDELELLLVESDVAVSEEEDVFRRYLERMSSVVSVGIKTSFELLAIEVHELEG